MTARGADAPEDPGVFDDSDLFDDSDGSDGSDDELYGFAVAVVYEDGRWSCTMMGDAAREGLDAAVSELRGLRASGPAFAMIDVDEAFFAVVRPGPGTVHVVLSDAVCALDYDLASDVLDLLGIDAPELSGEQIEDADPWPEGDYAVLADLGLPEPVLSVIMDEIDLYPDEQLAMIAERLGFADEFAALVGDGGSGDDGGSDDDGGDGF